ncbi:MAG: GAP family protein [Dehalococcoidia bacterium]|nr:GAP family protein [Dehalococcoidia bacterium]
MGDAIGQMLPSAVGIAISPIPIVAVVLMLVTPRGHSNGPAFALGWFAGIVILGSIIVLFASGADASDDSGPATWVSWLQLLLGVLLILLTVRQWGGRHRDGEDIETPKWMSSLDSFSPFKSLGMAVALSSINPKNLLLIVAGATSIAQTGIPIEQLELTVLIFALIASIGVVAPVGLYFVLGEKAGPLLENLKEWLIRNNPVIMAIILLILGVKLIGDAISGLS